MNRLRKIIREEIKHQLNEQAVVLVKGATHTDNNILDDIFEDDDFPYHGEWDSREGEYVFENDEDSIDDLATDIERYLEEVQDDWGLKGFHVEIDYNYR